MRDTLTDVPVNRLRFRQPSASDLCIAAPSVTTEQVNHAVLEVFERHRDLATLPVTEHEQPIGLINRSIFMSQMSKPFHRELYGHKSCIAFMDKEPLIVDADMSIEALTFKAVECGEKALADGFIITREGRYLGVGHGLQLMRVVADMQAEKNRQLMHSIEYASIIQRSMLRPSREALARTLADADLVWEPRDVVGGDFYHFAAFPDGWFAALADCTGHGVPGAFMTLIASSILGQAIAQHGPRDPGLLLRTVNRGVKQMLGQTDGRAGALESDDGLDATFVWFDNATGQLTFAAARSTLFVLGMDESDAELLAGDRMGVGYVDTDPDYAWNTRSVQTGPGMLVLMTTDGLVDQIGGSKDIAFGKRRIREAMVVNRHARATDLNRALLKEYLAWQGHHRRRDDLTVFCFRI